MGGCLTCLYNLIIVHRLWSEFMELSEKCLYSELLVVVVLYQAGKRK